VHSGGTKDKSSLDRNSEASHLEGAPDDRVETAAGDLPQRSGQRRVVTEYTIAKKPERHSAWPVLKKQLGDEAMPDDTIERRPSREALAAAFLDMEGDIYDLTREAELVKLALAAEQDDNAEGVLQIALDHLVSRIIHLQLKWRIGAGVAGGPGPRRRRRKIAKPKLTVVSSNNPAA
jgi:hypothetical protein